MTPQLPVKVLGFRGRYPVLHHACAGDQAAVELRRCCVATLRLKLLAFAPLEDWARAFPGGRTFDVVAAYDAILRAAEAAGPFEGPVGWTS